MAAPDATNFFSWSAQDAINPIPFVRAEGVYFWDADGKRYFDLNSQSMCVNIGHGDGRVIAAIQAQAATLTYAGPGMATPIRAALSKALAAVTPRDSTSSSLPLAVQTLTRMRSSWRGR